jgi:methylamine utilization protein MauE
VLLFIERRRQEMTLRHQLRAAAVGLLALLRNEGPPGGVNVSWGDWSYFVAYTAKINGFLPTALAPGLGVLAIAAELVLGLALLIGIWRRSVAWATCGLLTLFALAMTLSFVVKAPLSFSVFADAAGAAAARPYLVMKALLPFRPFM